MLCYAMLCYAMLCYTSLWNLTDHLLHLSSTRCETHVPEFKSDPRILRHPNQHHHDHLNPKLVLYHHQIRPRSIIKRNRIASGVTAFPCPTLNCHWVDGSSSFYGFDLGQGVWDPVPDLDMDDDLSVVSYSDQQDGYQAERMSIDSE